MEQRRVILIAHNIRSAHNIGSLMRTAEGLGAEKMYICGHSPYPITANDSRLPHIAKRAADRIHKTALGAEDSLEWFYRSDINPLVEELKAAGYALGALEQAPRSIPLNTYRPPDKLALIVGSEIGGIDSGTLQLCDVILEIPMAGRKESLNVSVAAGIALHHLKLAPDGP